MKKPIVMKKRDKSRVALFPRLVKGLEEEIDKNFTRIFYPLPSSRAVTVEGTIDQVIAKLFDE